MWTCRSQRRTIRFRLECREFYEARNTVTIHVRKATELDVPRLREVMEASVRCLQAENYSPAQIEGALRSVYGVDSHSLRTERIWSQRPWNPRRRHLRSSAVAGGAPARRCMEAINARGAKTHSWTRRGMRRRFEHFSRTRSGRGVASAP